jgi:hypothetical protein
MLYTHREDVDNYNNHIVDKLFQNSTIYNVNIDSNAFEMVELNCWIHDPKFNQIKKVAINVCVMITKNMKLRKVLIKGTMEKNIYHQFVCQ